jgi:hypothetical protein
MHVKAIPGQMGSCCGCGTGGNTQAFVPHVKGVDWKWAGYHFAGSSSSPSDIILEFPDNKIVRFRKDQ